MMNLDQILEEIEKVSNENLEDKYKKHIIGNLYSSPIAFVIIFSRLILDGCS